MLLTPQRGKIAAAVWVFRGAAPAVLSLTRQPIRRLFFPGLEGENADLGFFEFTSAIEVIRGAATVLASPPTPRPRQLIRRLFLPGLEGENADLGFFEVTSAILVIIAATELATLPRQGLASKTRRVAGRGDSSKNDSNDCKLHFGFNWWKIVEMLSRKESLLFRFDDLSNCEPSRNVSDFAGGLYLIIKPECSRTRFSGTFSYPLFCPENFQHFR
jgi:hypothetical protein